MFKRWVQLKVERMLRVLLSWDDSFVGKKKKKDLESCSFMPFLIYMEGREIGELIRIVKV